MLSRVADSLYWMSRYLERTEQGARVLGARFDAILEESPTAAARGWARLTAALGVDPPAEEDEPQTAFARRLTFDRLDPGAILGQIRMARENARQVREEIGADLWVHLNRLYLELVEPETEALWQAEPVTVYGRIVDGIRLVRGVADATMHHGEGWHFLGLGQYLERTLQTIGLIDSFFDWPQTGELGEGDLILLLRSAGAIEAYNRVYTAQYMPGVVAGYLLFDRGFPRSVRFSVERLNGEIAAIAGQEHGRTRGPAGRMAQRILAEIDFNAADSLDGTRLHPLLQEVRVALGEIHAAIIATHVAYTVEAAIAG
ncbi:MAG: alpha-E domain-containing protein [Alphaproteobacteria bacterium]|nr:alpha-E domain-containing protein [Alphaproteobacteria bacterium]